MAYLFDVPTRTTWRRVGCKRTRGPVFLLDADLFYPVHFRKLLIQFGAERR